MKPPSDAEWKKAFDDAAALLRRRNAHGLQVSAWENSLPKATVKAVRDAAKRFEKVTDVRHCVEVTLVPAPVVQADDGRVGFGVFEVTSDGRSGMGAITIGGDLTAVAKRHKLTAATCRRMLIETLAHELVHYEQWRDGRKITERGVEVRARTLLRKAGYLEEK